MPILPVSFSLMASFISSITLLGVSNEIYQFGTQFVIINISYGLKLIALFGIFAHFLHTFRLSYSNRCLSVPPGVLQTSSHKCL